MSAEIEIISVLGPNREPLPIHGTGFGSTWLVPVKQESDDDDEIQKMAAKMKEANKVALAKQQRQAAQMAEREAMDEGQEEPTNNSSTSTPSDEESQMGHFGWATFDLTYIPYIYRQQEKYCSVRMFEMKLIGKYLNCLHPDIYSRCTCVRSYYITVAEARLLIEINQIHCDGYFGPGMFTQKDLVVRLSDATKFYQFLDICYRKLISRGKFACVKCGFVLINKESVVPYTMRNGEQVLPLFYFEGETESLKQKADFLSGWDVAYLKFCCRVQGIRHDLFSTENIAVISLTDIKSYFPNGTEFEEHWPSMGVDLKILLRNPHATNSVRWTRQPSQPPPKVQLMKRGSATAAAAASALDNGQNQLQQPGAASAAQRMHSNAPPAAQAQAAAAAHQQTMKRGAQNLPQQTGAAAATPAQRMHSNAPLAAQAQAQDNLPSINAQMVASQIYINQASYAHHQHNVRGSAAAHHASNNGKNVAAAGSANQTKSKKKRIRSMNST